jgi:hypothetical protein
MVPRAVAAVLAALLAVVAEGFFTLPRRLPYTSFRRHQASCALSARRSDQTVEQVAAGMALGVLLQAGVVLGPAQQPVYAADLSEAPSLKAIKNSAKEEVGKKEKAEEERQESTSSAISGTVSRPIVNNVPVEPTFAEKKKKSVDAANERKEIARLAAIEQAKKIKANRGDPGVE